MLEAVVMLMLILVASDSNKQMNAKQKTFFMTIFCYFWLFFDISITNLSDSHTFFGFTGTKRFFAKIFNEITFSFNLLIHSNRANTKHFKIANSRSKMRASILFKQIAIDVFMNLKASRSFPRAWMKEKDETFN